MLITQPDKLEKYNACNRIWQGIPGIARSKKGRLFSTFYSGGIQEQCGNFCVLLVSDDDGDSWGEPIAVAYNGEQARCYDPCLWLDPLGRLWFFWAVDPPRAVWASICENPDAATLHFSEPVQIGHDVMMNKPTVLSTGEWLLPIAVWDPEIVGPLGKTVSVEKERKPFVYKSNDLGRSFTRLGGPIVENRSFDEHMVLERTDGVLLMYTRTRYGISQSLSYDGGYSWTAAVDSGLGGPDSRFFIRRLSSGRILLINHYRFKGRNNLTAMLSEDEGQSWNGYLLLDERENVSYPDAVEAPDGSIYIIYDRGRGGFLKSLEELYRCPREILMAKVTETDILAGKIVCPGSKLKKVVSKLGEYTGIPENPYQIWEERDENAYVEGLIQLSNPDIVGTIMRDYGYRCLNLYQEASDYLDESITTILVGDLDSNQAYKVYVLKSIIRVLRAASLGNATDVMSHTMKSMLDYLDSHLTEPLFLEEMARYVRVNKYYLCHLFKEKTGTTIIQYRNSKRIHRAKLLLKDSGKTITEIACEVGFVDGSEFVEWFKRLEDILPSEYRKLSRLRRP